MASAASSPPRVRTTALLDDLARGYEAHVAGSMDLFHASTLVPGETFHRPYGTLEGYVQRRRLSGLLMDPDSLVPLRLGLFGAWDQGGWTDDPYFAVPGNNFEDATTWSWGVAVARPRQRMGLLVGANHLQAPTWRGAIEDEQFEPTSHSAFAITRWKRVSGLGVVDLEGLGHLRAGFEPTSTALPAARTILFPQITLGANWSQARWNRWEEVDAWGVELGVPVWMDRICARAEAGDEGFRQVRMEFDLSSEGVVGVDVSYARDRLGRRRPGIRARIPLFTFGWNDPEDAATLGTGPSGPVWSARLQMAWKDEGTYWRPGRRPSPPESK